MRLKKLWLTLLLICCSLLVFTACTEARVAQSIVLNGYNAEAPLELTIGPFAYERYTVTVTYDNGEKETLKLTEDMIPHKDQLHFFQEGESQITIAYQGVQTSFAIKVSRNVFPENVCLNDVEVTYSGKAVSAEVVGDIPGGTKIIYPQDNTFTEAGKYDISAILQCDGYVTKELNACVTINPATYEKIHNFKPILPEKTTVVYNKEAHSVSIQEEVVGENGAVSYIPAVLPDGVNVAYKITQVKDNGEEADVTKAIDAGTYKVYAMFTGDAKNYQAIRTLESTLIIEPAVYNMSRIEFPDKEVTYSGSEHFLRIDEDGGIPAGISVSYQIKQLTNGRGEAVNDEYEGVNTKSAIDAGEYSVKAIFSVSTNANNYIIADADKEMEARLTIKPASYHLSVEMSMQGHVFDANTTYELPLEGELPEGVTPIFVLKKGSTVIEGTLEIEVTEEGKKKYTYTFVAPEPGDYICEVTFTHDNVNFQPITFKLSPVIKLSEPSSLD